MNKTKNRKVNMLSFFDLKNLFRFFLVSIQLVMISACSESVTVDEKRAQYNDIQATLSSIAVTPTNPSIANNSTLQFTATGTYLDGATQDVTGAVTWSSSGAAATISNAAGSNGLATAVAAGSTTITATSGSISVSTMLTITTATLVSITGGISGNTTLTAMAPNTVTLSWDAPMTYNDVGNTPLDPATDIAKYRIYYGTSSRTYTQAVDVVNPKTTIITQTLNLIPGTYFFAVTDIDVSGQESDYSNEVSRTI